MNTALNIETGGENMKIDRAYPFCPRTRSYNVQNRTVVDTNKKKRKVDFFYSSRFY